MSDLDKTFFYWGEVAHEVFGPRLAIGGAELLCTVASAAQAEELVDLLNALWSESGRQRNITFAKIRGEQ